ncbi:hypothetical protein BZA77DRAFT_362038 [Pyronema omphalodes]|nr:hypothetical protein BZA77DRAFT_362038 [Pyronema omphalodes]
MAIEKMKGQEQVEHEEWKVYTGMLVAGLRLSYSVTVQLVPRAAGIAHRQCPYFLSSLRRLSVYLNGTSDLLAAFSHRTRWPVMLVGECFSSLVDTGKMHMDFGTEDMDTPEAKWWKSITAVGDKTCSISALFTSSVPRKPKAKDPTSTAAVSRSTVLIREGEEEERALNAGVLVGFTNRLRDGEGEWGWVEWSGTRGSFCWMILADYQEADIYSRILMHVPILTWNPLQPATELRHSYPVRYTTTCTQYRT